MNTVLVGAVSGVVVSGALAIAGIERGVPMLTWIFKPLATLLLLAVIGWPQTAFARLIIAGILLSLVGDVALMSDDENGFMIGLVGFLAAHVVYIVANLSLAVWSPRLIGVSALVVVSTAILLRYVRPAGKVMRAAVIVYGVVISAMVISAWAMVGGRLAGAPLAAVGAVFFYVSDSSLALHRFHRPIPHVSYLALGVYWVGQMGIALAARGAVL